jgi:hypothetical protein
MPRSPGAVPIEGTQVNPRASNALDRARRSWSDLGDAPMST